MATTLYFTDLPPSSPRTGRYESTFGNGSSLYVNPCSLATSAAGATYFRHWTANGPVSPIGIPMGNGSGSVYSGTVIEWCTAPVSSQVTISGQITLSSYWYTYTANTYAAPNFTVYKMSPTGTLTEIVTSANTTQFSGSYQLSSISATPSSGVTLDPGDRLVVVPFIDDASSNMVGTYEVIFTFSGITNKIVFNETISFSTESASGTTLYFTSETGPDIGSGSTAEKEMWTSRGGSSTYAEIDAPGAGPVDPIPWTDTNGGNYIEWYSRRLNAFTLAGIMAVNIRVSPSSANDGAVAAEIAICDNSGGNITVWAYGSPNGGKWPYLTWPGGENALTAYLQGYSTSFPGGYRLRFRLYLDDDAYTTPGLSAISTWWRFHYDGPTASASGDTWLRLSETITEFGTGSFTADATLIGWGPWSSTWSNLVAPTGGTITADAVILRTVEGAFVADAIKQGTYEQYFLADAYILVAKSTGIARLSLGPAIHPYHRKYHKIKVRARTTGDQGTLLFSLYEGATLISGDLETEELTSSLADYELDIPEADAQDIVDYDDLEIRFYGFSETGASTVFEVDSICLELPPGYSFTADADIVT